MTIDQREKMRAMAEALEIQIEELLSCYDKLPREFKLAIDCLEEGASWMRKMIERS